MKAINESMIRWLNSQIECHSMDPYMTLNCNTLKSGTIECKNFLIQNTLESVISRDFN